MNLYVEIPIKNFLKAKSDIIRKQHNAKSIFISVKSPSSCPIFVYVFELFPSDSLGGTLFHQGDFEVR